MQANYSGFALTVVAAAAVQGKTFIGFDGAVAAAGGVALGVTREAAAAGEAVAVARSYGSAIVIAGEALAGGQAVQVGVDGHAVVHTNGAVVGYVAPGGDAIAGADVEILF